LKFDQDSLLLVEKSTILKYFFALKKGILSLPLKFKAGINWTLGSFIAVVINMFRLLDFLTGGDIIRNSLKL